MGGGHYGQKTWKSRKNTENENVMKVRDKSQT